MSAVERHTVTVEIILESICQNLLSEGIKVMIPNEKVHLELVLGIILLDMRQFPTCIYSKCSCLCGCKPTGLKPPSEKHRELAS